MRPHGRMLECNALRNSFAQLAWIRRLKGESDSQDFQVTSVTHTGGPEQRLRVAFELNPAEDREGIENDIERLAHMIGGDSTRMCLDCIRYRISPTLKTLGGAPRRYFKARSKEALSTPAKGGFLCSHSRCHACAAVFAGGVLFDQLIALANLSLSS